MRTWIRVNLWRTVISDHELFNYVTGKKRWIQWEIKHRLDTAIEPQSTIYCGYLVIRKREQKNVSLGLTLFLHRMFCVLLEEKFYRSS